MGPELDGWEKLIDAATKTTLARAERVQRLREHRQRTQQKGTDLTVEQLRDSTGQFSHAAELADDGMWTDDDDWEPCWRCDGQGWGIVGVDWDSDDPINGPYDGETETCPCCHGSGNADDCTYW